MCVLYISYFTKDLENQEVPGWLQNLGPEVTGFILVLVPVSQNLNFLALFWYPFWSYICSGSWKPSFVSSLVDEEMDGSKASKLSVEARP